MHSIPAVQPALVVHAVLHVPVVALQAKLSGQDSSAQLAVVPRSEQDRQAWQAVLDAWQAPFVVHVPE